MKRLPPSGGNRFQPSRPQVPQVPQNRNFYLPPSHSHSPNASRQPNPYRMKGHTGGGRGGFPNYFKAIFYRSFQFIHSMHWGVLAVMAFLVAILLSISLPQSPFASQSASVSLSASSIRQLSDQLASTQPIIKPQEKPFLVQYPQYAPLIIVQAAILTIYDQEGTYPSPEGLTYNYTFGHDTFEGFDDHPFAESGYVCKQTADGELCSAASGACQFMPETWKGVYSRYSILFYKTDPTTGEPVGKFAPINQDLACAILFREVGGDRLLLQSGNWGITPDGKIWLDPAAIDEAFKSVCCTWASLPCDNTNPDYKPSTGGCYKGQYPKPIEEIRSMYLGYLEQRQQLLIPSTQAATAPPPAHAPPQPAPQAAPQANSAPANSAKPVTATPVGFKAYKVYTDYLFDESPTGSYDLTLVDPKTDSDYVPVPSPCTGVVYDTYFQGVTGDLATGRGAGNIIKIECEDGYGWLGGHFADVAVQAGEKVVIDQHIGNQGMTGRASGPHLHIQIHYLPSWERNTNRDETEPIVRKHIARWEAGTIP